MRRRLGLVVLAPLLLTGCSKAASPTATPSPSGPAWIVLASGSATPSPAPLYASGSVAPFPTGYLPLPTTSPTPRPTGSYGCPPVKNNIINGASATASTTSGTVTWYNPATSDIVEYRITAISQDAKVGLQRDIGWTVVTPGATCGYMTATIVGLDRKTRYMFSVDAVTTRSDSDATYDKTVARSQVVTTS
ncbi:fibronectin type III domain-containing protein [Actinoplanes bogorensis]|uniref:Fibronectin type III domain-containing protein n=1 Tax=Paractinoplanes bogorensis TaxID=1610840 RepID=A0ABS5YWS4_9ACTN|nr:fibronectin type III domain-containing protein [Actinoplanes bogorensis]MBU2666555.1 fibronectin type III domain-containing protein [Actinoplanes bogorensis]